MPPTQRGQAYKLGPGKWGLRYYDQAGVRRRKSPFPTKSAALQHYREHIEPVLLGQPAPLPELTVAEFVELYLERHAGRRAAADDRHAARSPATRGARVRRRAAARAGDDDRRARGVAGARLPERAGHGIAQALRQALDAAVRWQRMTATRRRTPAATRSRRRGRCARSRAPRSTRSRSSSRDVRHAAGVRRGDGAAARRSGRRSSGATSTAAPASCTSGARCRAARSSSSGRRRAAAGRSRCRRARSTRSTRCRRGWTRRCCGRRPRAAC
jgi:hypothetical protein